MSTSSLLADAPVRRRIGPWSPSGLPDLEAFDPDTSFVVRAAAGSGKTTALVARMTALVRTGVPVDRIAAITFTRKAAGEMRERFFEELERTRRLLEEEGPQEELERVRTAREHLGRSFVGTIHAFCARLLRERPLEAGVPPDFTAGLDEREERELRRAVWQGYLAREATEEPETLDRLERFGVDPDDLFDLFSDLAYYEELEPYTDGPPEPPELDEAVAAAEAFVEEWIDRRPDALPEGRDPDGAMEALERAHDLRRHRGLDRLHRKARFLEIVLDLAEAPKRYVTFKSWGDSGSEAYEAARTLRDEVLPALAEEVRPAFRAWSAFLHGEMVDFVEPAIATYAERRRREGRLTFHDLLLVARDLLRDHPEVRRYFQERYRYVLVDEFQDTDPVQAEVLFYLTGENVKERSWHRCRPRPGSLFIVGDDKQSIYRFRRADLEVFERVSELVEEAGGEAVELTTNFRSAAAICAWCDRAFGTLFADEELGPYQADYVAFTPDRPGEAVERHVRRCTIGGVSGNWPGPIARREAARIAEFVAAARSGRLSGEELPVDEDVPLGEYLILTRTRSRLSTYAEALARRGIPYTMTGGGDLADSEQLRALVDLWAALERSDDPVARVAYLRGRLVGLSDDDLYRYRRAGGDFSAAPPPLDETIRAELPGGLADRLNRAFDRLERARALLEELSPAAAAARMVDEFGLAADAARPDRDGESGSLRAGRLIRALGVVRRGQIDGLHWTEIREELDRILSGEVDVDGMTLEAGTDQAVRLMNLHQAKGLEARVVFLADPYDRTFHPRPSRHVQRANDRIVLPAVRRFGRHRSTEIAEPLAWADEFQEEETRYRAAEEQRLQYVAATRAKDLLVVGRYGPKEEAGFWADLYPFLDEAGVPELEVPSREDPGERASGLGTAEGAAGAPRSVGDSRDGDVPFPDLEALRGTRRSVLDRIARPGYRVGTVTGEADGAPDEVGFEHPESPEESGHGGRGDSNEKGVPHPGEAVDGYGRAFGSAVHALLARAAQGRSSEEASVRAVLEAHEVASPTDDQIEAALRMVERFEASSLAERVRRADRVRTELPLAGITPSEEDLSLLERGVVDLLYEREDGWHLVDHKTDRVGGEGRIEELVRSYRPQVEAYARLWESIVGEPLASASLWLADAGEEVSVTGPPAAGRVD